MTVPSMREVRAGCLEIAAEILEELSENPDLTSEKITAKRQKACELKLQAYGLRNYHDAYFYRKH